jgi:hypothetical protein
VIALLTTVVVTVGLSVLLHGFTSVPLVAAYRRWYGAHAEAHPKAAEVAPARLPRRRQQPAADEAGLTLRDAGAAPCGEARRWALLERDGVHGALLGRLLAAAGGLAPLRVDDVRDAVVAQLEHGGAELLAPAASDAEVFVDYGSGHGRLSSLCGRPCATFLPA